MDQKVILTGIKPTGNPHLGNWVGAIRPTVELSRDPAKHGFYFIADYHALTGLKDAAELRDYTYQVAASWIALGLDPESVVFYRQSDVPEVFELSWILACFSPKGLMNRAHAYKAVVQKNQEAGEEDLDAGVNMGLYTYPILMAADILIMQSHWVPVGRDQQQHVEIARDLAQYFNRQYRAEVFTLPEALIDEKGAVIPGLDGRKMSKSYGNTIPIFTPPDQLRKLVFRIATDSSRPGEPKDPESSTIFQLYRLLAKPEDTEAFADEYRKGIAWKDAKEALYALLETTLSGPWARYQDLIAHPEELDRIFAQGAEKARDVASRTMREVRRAVGISH
ncbi:tryptophan--tRNA ligase [Sulfobacillus harzensis]|uniref:Tryptophan--tRNA ligase n=1 Tax=Sulfobacillus harzensis TaxID=2729629 RepID=A0A7Y0L7B4_9FIRM|nr:tryptophan--tRNA ligase [Sulfobacillus harzensis]NMP24277.1 tryptophan--tRNA ligase [Sulfobacillus harzensis]